MLPWSIEHILLTCIKIPNGFQAAFVVSISKWPLKTGFSLVHLRHAFSECIENPIETRKDVHCILGLQIFCKIGGPK